MQTRLKVIVPVILCAVAAHPDTKTYKAVAHITNASRRTLEFQSKVSARLKIVVAGKEEELNGLTFTVKAGDTCDLFITEAIEKPVLLVSERNNEAWHDSIKMGLIRWDIEPDKSSRIKVSIGMGDKITFTDK